MERKKQQCTECYNRTDAENAGREDPGGVGGGGGVVDSGGAVDASGTEVNASGGGLEGASGTAATAKDSETGGVSAASDARIDGASGVGGTGADAASGAGVSAASDARGGDAASGSAKPPPPPPPQMNYLPPGGGDADEPLPAEIEDPMCLRSNPRVIRFEDVTKASFLIKSGIFMTPCVPSHLPNITGMDIFLKQDFLQHTGSFKERGARYTLLMLSPEQKARGVISASAGNHALALSYHGRLLGVPVTVVMPVISPIMKVQNCRAQEATVIVKGKNMTEAKLWAMHWGKERGLMYVNGYDHPDILAGQGTCGLEIIEQVPDVDAVVVPVGGGGLIAGVAVAVKNMKPSVKVIGVEPEACQSFARAMQEGGPTAITSGSTLAEGLAVGLVGFNSYATAAPLVDKMVAVPEEAIAIAILRLAELEKSIVEGAGASGLAAVLSGQLEELRGQKVVLILSGGNIDTTVLRRVMDRGLAADGRLVKFTIPLVDRPGGLQELCKVLTVLGVSIKDLSFERAWMKSDVFSMKAHVVCETRDMDHANELQDALRNQFKQVLFGDTPFPE